MSGDHLDRDGIPLPTGPLEPAGGDVVDLRPAAGRARRPILPAAELAISSYGEVATRVAAAGEPRWLIQGLWPADAYGVLAAQEKAGKTWAALDLAVSVATGRPWLDHFPCPSPGPVLVFLGEGGERATVRRIEAIASNKGDQLADQLRLCFRVPRLAAPGASSELAAIQAELVAYPAALVVLDPLYLAAAGASGSNLYDMGAVLQAIQGVCQHAGCALLVVTHWNKTGDGRGADRISGAGPAAWARVICSVSIQHRGSDPGGASTVVLGVELIGGELADARFRIRRRVHADDPNDLGSPLAYAVEVLADDEDQDLDPAAAALSKSRQWVLTALRAGGELQTVKQLGDRLAQAGHPLKPRTIQLALGELEAAGLAAGSEEATGRARYWSPAAPGADGGRRRRRRRGRGQTMTPTGNRLDRCIREPRMEPRMARMRGVRAPHRRTAHTAHPPIRGCGVGCAVGGASLAPRCPRRHPPRGEGWSANRGEPPPRPRNVSPPHACLVLSRYPTRTPSAVSGHPDPHPPASGPQRAAHDPPAEGVTMASAGIRKTPTGRYRVWWRLDDASQGSQTFDTRDEARDFKNDLLTRLARGSWVDPRLGKQVFETWAREWWEVWSTDPDRSPATLQATEGRLRRYLLPFFGQRQLRAITVSMVRRWQNELCGTVGHDTVMACRSVLNRILQAAEDDRRIDANPVCKVPAPRPPVDADARLGHAKRRTYSPEEFGRLLAGARPFYRDHLLCLVGTGLRAGELLGLRAHRVDLAARRLEVLEVRYEAGRFGRGYKDRPKSATSIRVVPLAGQVADAIARQLPDGCPPSTLVFAGPGGGNGVPAGTRTALSRDNLHRAYHAAVARVADPTATLAYTPKRVLRALRDAGPGQTSEAIRDRLRGRHPTLGTVHDALWQLEEAGLAARQDVSNGQPPCWSPTDPPRDRTLDKLKLRGPHDLRHTFSAWLEDAGIPARVIDELMGHAGGHRGGQGSAIGLRYRHTTPEMEARVVAAIEQRLATSLAAAAQVSH